MRVYSNDSHGIERQNELGTPVPDIARKPGVAEQTVYRWKKLAADLSLDKVMLQDVISKKW